MIPIVDQKIEKSKETLKAFARKQKEKQAWANEWIYLEAGVQFRLPRKRCSPEELTKTVGFEIAYLQDDDEIVPLQDAIAKCRGKPTRYIVVPKPDRGIYDVAESSYRGHLVVLLEDVPEHDDFQHRVEASDLREWLMFGLAEEDPSVQKAVGFVGLLEAEIREVVKRMELVPFMAILNERGEEVSESEGDKERERRYGEFAEEKETLEKKLDKAKVKAQQAIALRDATRVVLTKSQRAWRCTFEESKLGEWACHKTDWDGVKLALGHVDDEGMFLPPYAGRSSVPDGSKEYLPDYRSYEVTMRGVRVSRVEDGFGVYDDFEGDFVEGQRSGKGMSHGDDGVFVGEFKDGFRVRGRFDAATGDSFRGDFVTPRYLPYSKLGNVYADGLPSKGRLVFADGSSYEGEFKDGRINGTGSYASQIETRSGRFNDGQLHGEGKWNSFQGTFQRGYSHGKGRCGGFQGNFEFGMKSGRGEDENFRGYYALDERCGYGTQGRWLMGRLRPYASHYMFNHRVMSKRSRRWAATLALDRAFRSQIIGRKLAIFRHAHNHAKKVQKGDATSSMSNLQRRLDDLVDARALSKDRADAIRNEGAFLKDYARDPRSAQFHSDLEALHANWALSSVYRHRDLEKARLLITKS